VSRRGGTAADLDLAIDALLADDERPLPLATSELLATARVLRDVLPRYHPRFGFEEHLARRLAAAGRPVSRDAAVAHLVSDLPRQHIPGARLPGEVATRPGAGGAGATGGAGGAGGAGAAEAAEAAATEGAEGTAARRRRGLLAGGAIASGVSLAIPIAGAALVAWRRGRTAGGSV
jgi:hypothetical protein